jgi:hypothetical protein
MLGNIPEMLLFTPSIRKKGAKEIIPLDLTFKAELRGNKKITQTSCLS